MEIKPAMIARQAGEHHDQANDEENGARDRRNAEEKGVSAEQIVEHDCPLSVPVSVWMSVLPTIHLSTHHSLCDEAVNLACLKLRFRRQVAKFADCTAALCFS